MTTTEREQLIKNVSALPFWNCDISIDDSGEYHVMLRKDQVLKLLENIAIEPTENSTEDVKDSDRCCQPNWEAMYKEEAAKNEDLRARNECQTRQLERAWASLRTFEFVYGRRLNGIC